MTLTSFTGLYHVFSFSGLIINYEFPLAYLNLKRNSYSAFLCAFFA